MSTSDIVAIDVPTITGVYSKDALPVLDLGDENGYWMGCMGHVDLYKFMVALAIMCDDTEVLAKGPHPQHAYMVRFPGTVDHEQVWWQLDPVNDEAESIEPVTILATGPGADVLTTRRATNPAK